MAFWTANYPIDLRAFALASCCRVSYGNDLISWALPLLLGSEDAAADAEGKRGR